MKKIILTAILFCLICATSLYSQTQVPVSGKTSTQQSVTQQTSATPQLLDNSQNQAGITLSEVNYNKEGYAFDIMYNNNALKQDDAKVSRWAKKYTVVDIEDLGIKHDVTIWYAKSISNQYGTFLVHSSDNTSEDIFSKGVKTNYYFTSLRIDTAVTSKVVAVCFQGTDAGEHRRLVTPPLYFLVKLDKKDSKILNTKPYAGIPNENTLYLSEVMAALNAPMTMPVIQEQIPNESAIISTPQNAPNLTTTSEPTTTTEPTPVVTRTITRDETPAPATTTHTQTQPLTGSLGNDYQSAKIKADYRKFRIEAGLAGSTIGEESFGGGIFKFGFYVAPHHLLSIDFCGNSGGSDEIGSFEYTYTYDGNSETHRDGVVTRKFSCNSTLLSYYFTTSQSKRFEWRIGASVGTRVLSSSNSFSPTTFKGERLPIEDIEDEYPPEDSATQIAFGVGTGLNWNISKRWLLDLSYRVLFSGEESIYDYNQGRIESVYFSGQTHQIGLSLGFRF